MPLTTPAEDALNQALARRLREGRLSLTPPMTQQQLATALGVSFQMIQKYESNQSRIPTGKIILAAKALNLPLDFLLLGFATEAPETPLPPLTKQQLQRSLNLILNNQPDSPAKSAATKCLEAWLLLTP